MHLDSFYIFSIEKVWRESIVTVITATASMASDRPATEDVEVTEISFINIFSYQLCYHLVNILINIINPNSFIH